MGFFEAVFRILGVIVALALVLFLAWIVLNWMNKRMPGMGTGTGRMLHVIDRIQFGRNNSIVLVRVKDKVFLIGFSEKSVEKLSEFDDPEGEIRLPDPPEGISFSAALKDAASKIGIGPKEDPPEKGGKE